MTGNERAIPDPLTGSMRVSCVMNSVIVGHPKGLFRSPARDRNRPSDHIGQYPTVNRSR